MLVEQVYIFGWSIATGAILGLLFDLFRGLRWEGIRDAWVYIQDVVFWIVTAVIIIVSSFFINEGEIRGYMFIGYLLGAGFYMLLFSHYILMFFQFVNKSIRKTFHTLKDALKKGWHASHDAIKNKVAKPNTLKKQKRNATFFIKNKTIFEFGQEN